MLESRYIRANPDSLNGFIPVTVLGKLVFPNALARGLTDFHQNKLANII